MPLTPPSAVRGHPADPTLSDQHPCVYRFGPIEVDFQAGELRKSGLRIHLQDQPLQVLSILLRHPGEIVSREEFRRLLWPADTFVDFDHGLNSAMKRLRDALNDDPDRPRFVETVPRHGYRFIAPVAKFPRQVHDLPSWHDAHSENARPNCESDPVDANSLPQWKRARLHLGRHIRSQAKIWLDCGAALLIVLILSHPTYGPQRYVDYGLSSPKLVVGVLPFQNLSGNQSENFIAEGMTQEVVTQMGREHDKQTALISGAALAQYKSTKNPISVMGRELGVAYVLEGSTRIEGTKVRIAAQLIRVRDQSYIWADSYDGDAHDILTVEATVAAAISRAVSERLPQ